MALRDTVELDTAAALRDIRTLGAALTQVTQQFRRDLAESTDVLSRRTAIKVSADTSQIRRATTEMKQLGDATEQTTAATGKYGRTLQAVAQIRVVQGLIAFFGGRALLAGISGAAEAASNLNEQVSLSQTVFEHAQGAIQKFVDSAADIGLARDQALEFSNAFGNLLTNAGFSADQAATETEKLVRLGADIAAAFNLGSVEEGLVKLRAGLVGEVEPLRSIGAGFTAAEVESRALAQGLAANTDELTQQDLILTRLQIIYERTRNAQGNFAATSKDLAQQQKILKAEVRNLQIEVGAALLPVFLELTQMFRAQAPVLAQAAKDLVPSLVQAFRIGVPVFISAVQVFAGFAPVLESLATIIEHIPTPLLTMITAFGLFGSGLGPLPNLLRQFGAGLAAVRVEQAANKASALQLQTFLRQQGLYLAEVPPKALGAAKAMGTFTGAMSTAALAVSGVLIALPILTSLLGDNAEEMAKQKAAVTDLAAAFRDLDSSFSADVTKFVSDRFDVAVLRRIGLTVAEVSALMSKGAEGVAQFRRELESRGIKDAPAGLEGVVTEQDRLTASFERAQGVVRDLAKAEAERLLSLDQITETELQQAEARNRSKDGTVDYLAVLQQIAPASAKAVAGQQDLGAATEDTADAMDELDKSIKKVTDQLDVLVGRFIDTEQATIKVREAARDVAEALGEGAKKGEGLATFQDRLREGTLKLVEAVQTETEALAKNGDIAVGAIPQVMLQRLEELRGKFPELAGQIQVFIDRILDLQNKGAAGFTLNADTSPAEAAMGKFAGTVDQVQSGMNLVLTVDVSQGQATMEEFLLAAEAQARGSGVIDETIGKTVLRSVPKSAATFDAQLGGVVSAGRAAGQKAAEEAMKEAEKAFSRQSGRFGANIAGFIVDGLDLGFARSMTALETFFAKQNPLTAGVAAAAEQVDANEALAILKAVERQDNAAHDLAVARRDLGSASLAAKIAELELADAQQDVFFASVAAVSVSKQVQEELERETAIRQKLTDVVGNHISALRALKAIEDARRGAADAAKARQREADDVAAFDRAIATQRALLARATAARVGAGLSEPSIEERRATATLRNLESRRPQEVDELRAAESDLAFAQLDVVDAQLRLVEAGESVVTQQGALQEQFRLVAMNAGLSADEIDRLTESLRIAADVAVGSWDAIVNNNPGFVSSSPLSFTAPQNTLTGFAQSGFASQPVVSFGDIIVTGQADPAGTAAAVVTALQNAILGAA